MRFRISSKILSFLGQSPQYINNLFSVRNQSAYQLRSNDGLLLDFRRGEMLHLSFRDRSFSVAALTLQNTLPISLRKSEIVQQFKSLLKTYFF